MNKVFSLGIPHLSELIFDSIDTPGLFKCLEVSQTWKVLALNVLLKRWKGKMFKACKNGETKVVQLLLEHCSSEESGLNIEDNKGWTPMMIACKNGHKDVVQLLLDYSVERNIDLNAKSSKLSAITASMAACFEGHKDVVKLLLDNSAEKNIDFNSRTNEGGTAFMSACCYGHTDVVRLLLYNSSNIDFNARCNEGRNAFMWACANGQKDVIKLLFEHSNTKGIDVSTDELFNLSKEIAIFILTCSVNRRWELHGVALQ